MTAMNFYMPTKVYQEWNAVANHAEEIASFGKKALIVTGRHSSKQNGSLADVMAALETCGTEYIVYDRIEENPSIATVMDAAGIGREQGADFVIGVGGGCIAGCSSSNNVWNRVRGDTVCNFDKR